MFEFLGDSTHALAGKNVPIPDLPDWFVRKDDEETEETETKEG